MANISQNNLIIAIKKAQNLSLKEKKLVCDEIFVEQPNLLASVLAQKNMGGTFEDVDVLLNILIVLYLAVKESGNIIVKITEDDQARELRVLSEIIKFTEGMHKSIIHNSINQCFSIDDDKMLVTYVIGTLKDAKLLENEKDNATYILMAGLNLLNCLRHAKKLA
jgi:hypothetical protein